jgi:hypothetical protein
MISMATPNLPDDGNAYFRAVALEAEDHAATVEVAAGMVQLALLGPTTIVRATFTYDEARVIAYSMIEASQLVRLKDCDA